MPVCFVNVCLLLLFIVCFFACCSFWANKDVYKAKLRPATTLRFGVQLHYSSGGFFFGRAAEITLSDRRGIRALNSSMDVRRTTTWKAAHYDQLPASTTDDRPDAAATSASRYTAATDAPALKVGPGFSGVDRTRTLATPAFNGSFVTRTDRNVVWPAGDVDHTGRTRQASSDLAHKLFPSLVDFYVLLLLSNYSDILTFHFILANYAYIAIKVLFVT